MDILLLILLAVGFISGLFSGAVKQVISLVAFVAGFLLACIYYQTLGDILTSVLNFPTFCILPVVGMLNRLLGGLLCLAKYALILGALIWLFSSAKLLKEETMQQSKLCLPLKALPELVYNALATSRRDNPTNQIPHESDATDAPCDTIPDGSSVTEL